MTDDINETTSLLPTPQAKRPTPLPKLQLAIIMLVQICEPLTSQSIYPYINQLVSELDITGGDEKKVGYYAGLESLFFITEALTVLQWSRVSDRIGRKPILLVGLFGSAVSMLCFGLSRTFWALVISRCLTGLLNGNTGDLTDSSNRAQGFAYVPLIWATGTVPSKNIIKQGDKIPDSERANISKVRGGPLPLRELFIFPIIISISNYVTLAFLNIALAALLPLFLTMPIEIGGLGLPPKTIGLILASYGVVTGVFQVSFFSLLVRRFGEKRVFLAGLSTCLPIFALFPIMSLVAKGSGLSFMVWIFVGCVLTLGAVMDSSFGMFFFWFNISVADNSPRGHIHVHHGVRPRKQSWNSRAIGPALSTSLFSFSVEHNVLGGYAVYAFFFVLSAFALLLGRRLPEKVWEEVDS
ncbi:major facilitator superfamily domain-containing protein [Mycena capillaripes]|nr:major facilitator superfamily domain-containing protein [Mycena capillaripes]